MLEPWHLVTFRALTSKFWLNFYNDFSSMFKEILDFKGVLVSSKAIAVCMFKLPNRVDHNNIGSNNDE